MDSIDGIPEDAPQIRLCQIKKRSDFNGYGFNLHAEKSKPGQFIGTVDERSPAERAGLKEGDRIVEVNDVNICHENHKQVVARIKVISDETRLLVVDKETEDYYRNKEIVITRDLPTVVLTTSDDDYVQPPKNNNYMAEDERRNRKKLGNVGHQSFVAEDDEDDVDEINFAMQRTDTNPPPLPNSAPPISDEDEERINQEQDDRNSLGGSSYDKEKNLDTDGDLLPPPPNEAEFLKEEEMAAKDTANKMVVTATIESSSEDGDDPQEDGMDARSNSIPEITGSIQTQDSEEGKMSDILKVEDEQMPTLIGLNYSGNSKEDKDILVEKPTGELVENKDGYLETASSSSESIPDDLDDPLKQNLESVDGELKKDDEETHSNKSIHSGVENEEMAKDTITKQIHSSEAVEWNMKMANMGNSVDSRSLSTASVKNENGDENTLEENEPPLYDAEITVTTDTIVSKENVKIEVTRQRKKTEPQSLESADSFDVSPPMPAPRTVTPISEKSSTASMDESSLRSFSPSSLEHSASLPPNTNDVVDASSNHRGKNWDGLNLNMTAREMRERIGSKKKKDPRKEDRLDFRTKYEMIQAL